MDKVEKLLKLILELDQQMGTGPLVAVLVLVIVAPVAFTMWRDHKVGGYFKMVIAEKEAQIQRIKEENSQYRALFFHQQGMPEALIRDLMESKSPAQPLDGKPPPSKPNPPKKKK